MRAEHDAVDLDTEVQFQVTLDRVEFFDNEVAGDGAAVSTSGGTAVTTIDHCDFHQNVAAGAGGAAESARPEEHPDGRSPELSLKSGYILF